MGYEIKYLLWYHWVTQNCKENDKSKASDSVSSPQTQLLQLHPCRYMTHTSLKWLWYVPAQLMHASQFMWVTKQPAPEVCTDFFGKCGALQDFVQRRWFPNYSATKRYIWYISRDLNSKSTVEEVTAVELKHVSMVWNVTHMDTKKPQQTNPQNKPRRPTPHQPLQLDQNKCPLSSASYLQKWPCTATQEELKKRPVV